MILILVYITYTVSVFVAARVQAVDESDIKLVKDVSMELNREELPIHEDHEFVFHLEMLEALAAREEGFTSLTIQHAKSGAEDGVFLNLAPLHGNPDALPFDTRTDGLFHAGSEYWVLDHYDPAAVREISDEQLLLCNNGKESFSNVKENDYILGTGAGEFMKSHQVTSWMTSTQHVGPRVKKLLHEGQTEAAGFTVVRRVLGAVPINDRCTAVKTKTVHPSATLDKFVVDSFFHKGFASEAAEYHEKNGIDAFELQRRNRENRRYLEDLQAYEDEVAQYPEGSYVRSLFLGWGKSKPPPPPYIDSRNGVRYCDDKFDRSQAKYMKQKYRPWKYSSWTFRGKADSYMWFIGTPGGCIQLRKTLAQFNFNYNTNTNGAATKSFQLAGSKSNGITCNNCYAYLGAVTKATLSFTSATTIKMMIYVGGSTQFNMDIDMTSAKRSFSASGNLIAASKKFTDVQIGYFVLSWAFGGLGYEITGRSDASGSVRGHSALSASAYVTPWYGGKGYSSSQFYFDTVCDIRFSKPRLLYDNYSPKYISATASLTAKENMKLSFGYRSRLLGSYTVGFSWDVGLRKVFKFDYRSPPRRRMATESAYQSTVHSLNSSAWYEESLEIEKNPDYLDMDTDLHDPILDESIFGTSSSTLGGVPQDDDAYADLEDLLHEAEAERGDGKYATDLDFVAGTSASHLSHSVETFRPPEVLPSGRPRYVPGDTLSIRYTYSGMPPLTDGRVFFALQTASGDAVPIGQEDYTSSDTGGGVLVFTYLLPWHQVLADPDGVHPFRVIITNSEDVDNKAVSEPISIRMFSPKDTIFTADGTSALRTHGGVLVPETSFAVTWAPHLLHHFHQEAYETWNGVHMEAKNVQFELRGEVLDADGTVVSTTQHQVLTSGLEGQVKAFPNTGEAFLSFPRELTSTLSGHRFYLVIQDCDNTFVHGWSSGYFRFHPGLTPNGLPLIRSERSIEAAFDISHAPVDNKADYVRDSLTPATSRISTASLTNEAEAGKSSERRLETCKGGSITLSDSTYLLAGNVKANFNVFFSKSYTIYSRVSAYRVQANTYALCIPVVSTPPLCTNGRYSASGRAPCSPCGYGERSYRPLGSKRCVKNGPTGGSTHVSRCVFPSSAATTYDKCINRYQTSATTKDNTPGTAIYEECQFCWASTGKICLSDSWATAYMKKNPGVIKCGKPPPPQPACGDGTFSSTGKAKCSKCGQGERSVAPQGSTRCVKNGPKGDSTHTTACDAGNGITPTYNNCVYSYMTVTTASGSKQYEDCEFCIVGGTPKCYSADVMKAYKQRSGTTCPTGPPAPPPKDCTKGKYSSTGKAPCTACGSGERSEKVLGSTRCVPAGGRTEASRCTGLSQTQCAKYYMAVDGGKYVNCQYCKYPAVGQNTAGLACLTPNQMNAYPTGSVKCGDDIPDETPTSSPTKYVAPASPNPPSQSTKWTTSCLSSTSLSECEARHTTSRRDGSKLQCHYCSYGGRSVCIDENRMDSYKKSKEDMVCGVEYCKIGYYSSTGKAPCTACGSGERSEKVLGSTRCVSADTGVSKDRKYTQSCRLWSSSLKACDSYYTALNGEFLACGYCSHYGYSFCRDTATNEELSKKYPQTYTCGVEYCTSNYYSSTGKAPCTPCASGKRSEKVEGSTRCVPNNSGVTSGRKYSTSCHSYKESYADCNKYYTVRDGEFTACDYCAANGMTWCMDSLRSAKYKASSFGSKITCGVDFCKSGYYSSNGKAPCTACGRGERSEKVLGSTRCVSADTGVTKGRKYVKSCYDTETKTDCGGAYTIYNGIYQACNYCTYKVRNLEKTYCLPMTYSQSMTKYYPDAKVFSCSIDVKESGGGGGGGSGKYSQPTDDDNDDQAVDDYSDDDYDVVDDDDDMGGSPGFTSDDDSKDMPSADDDENGPVTVPGASTGDEDDDGDPKNKYSTPDPPSPKITGWLITKLYPTCSKTTTEDVIMHSVEAVGICKFAGVRARTDMYMLSAYDEGKLGVWYFSGEGAEKCDKAALNKLPSGNAEFVIEEIDLGTCIRASFEAGFHSSVTTYTTDVTTCPKADFGSGMGYAYFDSRGDCGTQSLTSYLVTNPVSCYRSPSRNYRTMSMSSVCAESGEFTTVSSYPNNNFCNSTDPIVEGGDLVSCTDSAEHNNIAFHEGYLVSSNTGRYYSTFCGSAPEVSAGGSNGNGGDADSNSKSSASVMDHAGNMYVVGGVVGALLCICCLIFAVCYIRRKRKKDDITTTEIIIEGAPQQPEQPNGEVDYPQQMDPEFGANAYTSNPLHSKQRPSLPGDQPPPPPSIAQPSNPLHRAAAQRSFSGATTGPTEGPYPPPARRPSSLRPRLMEGPMEGPPGRRRSSRGLSPLDAYRGPSEAASRRPSSERY